MPGSCHFTADRGHPVGQAVPQPGRRHVRAGREVEGRPARRRVGLSEKAGDEHGGEDKPGIGGGPQRYRQQRPRAGAVQTRQRLQHGALFPERPVDAETVEAAPQRVQCRNRRRRTHPRGIEAAAAAHGGAVAAPGGIVRPPRSMRWLCRAGRCAPGTTVSGGARAGCGGGGCATDAGRMP